MRGPTGQIENDGHWLAGVQPRNLNQLFCQLQQSDGFTAARVSQNQQALQELQLGMSAAAVRSVMGQGEIVRYKKTHLVDPWSSESFTLVDGSDVLILFYVTEPPRRYYRAEDHELTPIVLENDRVVGWGWSYLRRNTDRYRISTPREQL